MVKLSQQAIEDFKKIYLNKFDTKIPDSEANKLGVNLLEFFRLIYKPIPRSPVKSLVTSAKGGRNG